MTIVITPFYPLYTPVSTSFLYASLSGISGYSSVLSAANLLSYGMLKILKLIGDNSLAPISPSINNAWQRGIPSDLNMPHTYYTHYTEHILSERKIQIYFSQL